MQKKIMAVVFAGILLAPLSFLTIFQVKQQVIQHHMREELEEKMLHTITLLPSQINWMQGEKEVVMDGRLFDVEAVTYNTDGSVSLKGLFDDEETLLVQQLQKNHQRNNSENNRQLVTFFSFQLDIPQNNILHSGLAAIVSNRQQPLNYLNLPVRYKDILTPPPRVC